MTATSIEFHAVARALPSNSPVSQYGYRARVSQHHGLYVLLLQAGIGPDRARKGTRQLFANAVWDVVISTGFAGDLERDLIGSVLVGHEVCFTQFTSSHVSPSSPSILCHPDWIQTAKSVQESEAGFLRTGKFVSVNHVLTGSEEKQTLRASTEAVGVDMESAAIGEVAQENGTPFLIVRTVSDGVHEDLPVDFNLFLRPSGWLIGTWRIMTTPKSWKGLIGLYQHSKQASRQLTKFFKGFFSAISNLSSAPRPSRRETPIL